MTKQNDELKAFKNKAYSMAWYRSNMYLGYTDIVMKLLRLGYLPSSIDKAYRFPKQTSHDLIVVYWHDSEY